MRFDRQNLTFEYDIVLDSFQLDALIEKILEYGFFVVDTETTSIQPLDAQIVGISIALPRPLHAYYIPVAHKRPGTPAQLSREYVLEKLRPLLESEEVGKLGQNMKYDMHVFANHGIAVRGVVDDTMVMNYVIESHERHDMDRMALRALGHSTIHYEDVCGKGKASLSFDMAHLSAAAEYSVEDAVVTYRLAEVFEPALSDKLRDVYELDRALIPILMQMERNGCVIDTDALAEQSTVLREKQQELLHDMHRQVGVEFNPGSPKQIGEVLFHYLGLPLQKLTPSGGIGTDEGVMDLLADQGFSIAKKIVAWRKLDKLCGTYTEALPRRIRPSTGRVHTTFNQSVAITGRLSSSDPNLQNIPIVGDEGKKIRAAFIASPGHQLVAADYSQIELRIMAHMAQEEAMLRAFREGRDIHQATASECFNVPYEEAVGDLRRAAKTINFGLIYGMTKFGLAANLGKTPDEAQEYIDLYFSRFPGVRDFMARMQRIGREQGYVETFIGRRIYLPDLQHKHNTPQKQHAERVAVNAPIQGSAAEVVKRAMVRLWPMLLELYPDVRLILQVHDELVFEVPEARVEEFRGWLIPIMESVAPEIDSVRLLADAGVGDNWGEAH